MKGPRVETYQLKTGSGRPIRKATRVVFPDGKAIAFTERFSSKRSAIEQATRLREKNPAELVLMGANPLQMVNSHFSEDEKLALGRLGISWKGIQTAADVRKARRALKDAAAIRRRFKNPHQNPLPMSEQRERAAEIYSGFHATPPENKIVLDEPHIPAGAYPELGLLMLVTFKPNKKARDGYEKNYVNEKENVHVIGSLDRDQIYFAGGDQAMSENDLRFFGWSGEDLFHLGAATKIVYLARKYHEQIEENARGELVEWVHELGEETGEKPQFWYDVRLKRIFFRQGAYEIRDEGIVN